ncbi:hypothetical protein, partial [Commensalibacter nepenthis]
MNIPDGHKQEIMQKFEESFFARKNIVKNLSDGDGAEYFFGMLDLINSLTEDQKLHIIDKVDIYTLTIFAETDNAEKVYLHMLKQVKKFSPKSIISAGFFFILCSNETITNKVLKETLKVLDSSDTYIFTLIAE